MLARGETTFPVAFTPTLLSHLSLSKLPPLGGQRSQVQGKKKKDLQGKWLARKRRKEENRRLLLKIHPVFEWDFLSYLEEEPEALVRWNQVHVRLREVEKLFDCTGVLRVLAPYPREGDIVGLGHWLQRQAGEYLDRWNQGETLEMILVPPQGLSLMLEVGEGELAKGLIEMEPQDRRHYTFLLACSTLQSQAMGAPQERRERESQSNRETREWLRKGQLEGAPGGPSLSRIREKFLVWWNKDPKRKVSTRGPLRVTWTPVFPKT